MIRKEQYAPILKGKQGEFIALSKLPDSIKDTIVPIVEIVFNPGNKFENHIKATVGYLKKMV
ncbi:MAG: beta family protein [Bacteroidetes bacterium]|nr:beta family protein [Bacteroidota bacterium]MBU2506861.1 beta family protein [Bacteroidota bacterium]